MAAAEEEDFLPEEAAGEEDVVVSLPEVVAEVEVDVVVEDASSDDAAVGSLTIARPLSAMPLKLPSRVTPRASESGRPGSS